MDRSGRCRARRRTACAAPGPPLPWHKSSMSAIRRVRWSSDVLQVLSMAGGGRGPQDDARAESGTKEGTAMISMNGWMTWARAAALAATVVAGVTAVGAVAVVRAQSEGNAR